MRLVFRGLGNGLCICSRSVAVTVLRPEGEGQPVDLAGELERAVVVVFDEGNGRARVHAHVEGLVLREHDRRGVLQGFGGDDVAIHDERAGAALAEAGAVGLEVEQDGVFAGLELRAFPGGALEAEQVVEKDRPCRGQCPVRPC